MSTAGVWIDWDNDGFATVGSTAEAGALARMMPEGASTVSDDITTDVISFAWNRGSTSDLLGGGNDGATIVVKNTNGKYNSDNGSSTLNGKLRPGRRVWVGVNADGSFASGTVYGIFAGRVREIAPIPAGGASYAPTAEIICDGVLADFARRAVRVADSTSRSQGSFRAAVLTAIGVTSVSLADEPDTLPLSSADSTNALSVLEELNRANGSFHDAIPDANLATWYVYTSRNRQYHLGSGATASLDAGSQHVTSIDGLRLNLDTLINDQEATVDPVDFPLVASNIWEYANAPFDVTGNLTIWADYGDYVADQALQITSTGAALTSTLTSFGRTAKIELSSTGATVQRMYVNGRMVIRDATIKVNSDLAPKALPSQANYGVATGSPLSGDLLGSRAAAQGIVDHIIYRRADPLRRPSVTVTQWLPTMFAVRLYDVLSLTVAQLSMTARLFDVVGLSGSVSIANSTVSDWTITYQLQESSLQSSVTFFTLNTSTLGGSDVLAY